MQNRRESLGTLTGAAVLMSLVGLVARAAYKLWQQLAETPHDPDVDPDLAAEATSEDALRHAEAIVEIDAERVEDAD